MTDGCKSILFYSDAADFGGHEALTLAAVRYLSSDGDRKVSFVFYEGNQRLRERLEGIQNSSGNLTLNPLPFRSKNLQAIRSLATWTKTRRVQALMKQINPDVVVVSQGRIEGSSLGLLAARRAGFRTVSYIPMAHPVSVSGKPFAVWLREEVNRYFYRLPHRFITSSEGARRMLLSRGATRDIVVVPNGLEVRAIGAADRQRFREAHGIGREDYVVAVVGRIDFRQKAQDFAIQAIARFRGELRGCKFLFVGSGPDEVKLGTMIESLGLNQEVQMLPWTPDPAEIYAGIDMLLVPSKLEGVPLVMQEAMSCKLPVVASNVDGMAETLPESWLFPYGDCRALVNTLLHVKNTDNSDVLDLHRNRIINEFTISEFGARFRDAILK
jgi:glycosyltransferase involved in cell wall biosynthesis